MLSVIGMIRFAMGITENIVMKSDSYSVEELKPELDPSRSIKHSLLAKSQTKVLLQSQIEHDLIGYNEQSQNLIEDKQKKLNESSITDKKVE